MKRTSLISLFTLFFVIAFSSCSKEDEYIDWKIINEQWLADNLKNDSIVQTASGLQYKVIHQGWTGSRKANSASYVVVNYEGKLINDSVFDSGTKQGFYLSDVVVGWMEGIKKMNEGGKYILYIPSSLAYGKDGNSDDIPPYSTLIFEIELIASYD